MGRWHSSTHTNYQRRELPDWRRFPRGKTRPASARPGRRGRCPGGLTRMYLPAACSFCESKQRQIRVGKSSSGCNFNGVGTALICRCAISGSSIPVFRVLYRLHSAATSASGVPLNTNNRSRQGKSATPQDRTYWLQDHVDNLERFALALDLRAITPVMHDFGGPVDTGLASRHPERIHRVISVNGPTPFGQSDLMTRLTANARVSGRAAGRCIAVCLDAAGAALIAGRLRSRALSFARASMAECCAQESGEFLGLFLVNRFRARSDPHRTGAPPRWGHLS